MRARSEYHFVTRWQVVGTIDEVSEILEKPEDLPRWWPSVYLEAKTLSEPVDGGVGRVVRVRTKGWLPYTLSWVLKVVESRRPHGFTIEVWGDFVGRGVWTFEQEGAWVDIAFDWRVSVEKPGIKELSPLLKPVFSANHRWAMRRGEESLKLELARRRGARSGVPVQAPPGPTTESPWPLILAALAVLLGGMAVLGSLARARRRRHKHKRARR